MADALVPLRRKPATLRRASAAPFGAGFVKPHHYLEMLRIAWENRGSWGYAWRVLNDGVCDGCALGTSGLSDWTIDGTHLCLVRLNLLRLNTMGPFDPDVLSDVRTAERMNAKELRDLGRIPYPMRRRKGEPGFTRVSWDEALEDIGERIRDSDRDRIACYMTSRGITNEVYFAAQKAWRLLGSPHIDNAARLCHSPSTKAMKNTLGAGASTCSYRDWYSADVIVFFGSNPANDQPVALKYLYEAKKRHGTRVLVVNTYEEPGMQRYWIPSTPDSAVFGTEIADRFFHVSTGGDIAFLYAVQKVLVERGDVDHEWIENNTSGWSDYVAHLDRFELGDLIHRSGATEDDVRGFADELGPASTGVFVWSMGITQHSQGGQAVEAICSLGLSKGFVGREGCGMMPIRGHSGVQGGAEMGAYATVFPGGEPIGDEAADRLEKVWGFRPPAQVGLDTTAMLEAADRGEIDVMYQMGGNFRGTLPQPDAVDRATSRIPLRIHQDIFLTHPMLAEPNDAVYLLPAKTRYEHEGGVTETTTERRVIFSPHIPGHEIGEAREEWRIAIDIARAAAPELAEKHLDYADAAALRRDIARTIPKYRGIELLENKGDQFQWGGPRLCEDGAFGTDDGKGHFVVAEPPDRSLPEGRFHLATRRGKQFNSIVQAEIDQLTGAARDHLFMNAEDMRKLGVAQDQSVTVRSEHGELTARVFEAPITPGNVQMHWPEANVLIDDTRRDAHGGVPDYNAIVTIEPLARAAE
ncbi:MAG: FdhF/YdeP family oxidoreductase [Polyangiales bacterium]